MIIPTHVVIFSGVGGWEVAASLTVMRPLVVTVATDRWRLHASA
jgi:hypothetical protein